ncbi:MAG: hypothetical protein KDA96_21010 [Planctomycetaceae bacterium]|nr:hypothetical protein [Planctomycetaceae bacterium]
MKSENAEPKRMSPIAEPGIDCICTGDAREMGIAQGAAMRDKISQARQVLSSLEAFRLRQPSWMPYSLYRRLAEHKSQQFLTKALPEDFSAAAQRLQGIAQGSQLPYRTICLFNALEPLLSSIADSTACPGACSAVAVTGRRAVSEHPIVAHNFDYLPIIQPFYMVRECQPDGKLRSLEFTTAPLAGAVDGINEAGLVITYDYAFTTDTPAGPAAPISLAISRALANCRTVEEAAAEISSCRRWGGALLMLADASGAIASLELSSSRAHLRHPDSDSGILSHSNAFSDPGMRTVQIPDNAVYDNHAPSPLRGRRVHESSARRDARFQTLLADAPALDADRLATLMADHGPDGIPGNGTPCVHSSYWFTTACLQFFPRQRRMRVAYASACQACFQTFEL